MRGVALFMGVSVFVLCASTEPSLSMDDMKSFAKGAKEMWKAYREMREANHIGSDHYFRAKGNQNASKQGRGGREAARIISKAKTMYNNIWRKDWMDEQTDFEADVWGRALLDINRFRPKGLDPKY